MDDSIKNMNDKIVIINNILNEVFEERQSQYKKCGEQNYSLYKWITILGEEVGEACKAALESFHGNYRKELIQVAAVAVAMIESYDSNREI